MRRLATVSGAALVLGGSALAGQIDSGLEPILRQTPENETISVLVYLSNQLDTDGLTRQLDAERATLQQRNTEVVLSLQDLAAVTQGDLLAELNTLSAAGDVEDFHAYWVGNIIRVDGTPEAIRAIARRNDVATVYFNYPIELIKPVPSKAKETPGDRAVEVGVEAVRAPEVWALGITGEGILTSTLDTGVDGNHPALASRWRGVADPRYVDNPEWAFFDPVTNQTFPFDSGTHGTHTMGSVCGGLPGDEIGVAPGAQWIHCAVIDRVNIGQTVADAILSFQWLLDPNEDPNTNWDVPAVCSNSWGLATYHGYDPCDETFWVYLDNCEAAGIVILFSAGNEGTSGLRRPADRATDDYRTCAVAAVDANNPAWPIAGFSSRGPTNCTPDGTWAIKPDIAAPGVDVRSSVPGGGYSYYSGTSMASPHVNGVVVLIRQACPDLTVEVIKQIIYDTAYDLGDPGEDNDYGWGMIDAYEAVIMAQGMCGPSPPIAYDGYWETPKDTPVTIALEAVDWDHDPDPPGELTYIIVSLPEYGVLTDVGAGEITEVPYELVNYGNEVIYDPVWYYTGQDTFTFKANDGGEPPDAGDSNIATIYITVGVPGPVILFDLDENPGWSTQGQWEFGQPTGQGGTQFGYPDPTSGATGLNVYGVNLNGDYSTNPGGPWYLASDAIDCTGLTDVELHFQRWLNTDYQPYAYATIEVSNDGVNWEMIWENGGNEIAENAWSDQSYGISTIADGQPTVYVRWGYQIGNGVWAYSGWNIDDIQIWAVEPFDCPADVNVDGLVDIDDVFAVLAAWGPCDECIEDINNDGMVDIDDVFLVLAFWGPC
ncbi:MAG: S8 family serine peptidase [Phycisphaerales bacterium]|nr:MAG: S8 family serine peptidase [Phycisphaerales bacterium]